jgi:hypothetical protein
LDEQRGTFVQMRERIRQGSQRSNKMASFAWRYFDQKGRVGVAVTIGSEPFDHLRVELVLSSSGEGLHANCQHPE